jgi:hypothetical protein
MNTEHELQPPVIDPELTDLFREVESRVGKKGLDLILQAHKPHNHGGYAHIDEEYDPYYLLRSTFRHLPYHLDLGQRVGFNLPDQIDLVTHVISSNESLDAFPVLDLEATSRVFEAAYEWDIKVTKSDKNALLKLVTNAAEDGYIGECLYTTSLGVNVGLTIPDAAHLAFQIPDYDRGMAGYTLPEFLRTLKTLIYTDTDPHQIFSLFDKLGDQTPKVRSIAYSALQLAFLYGCRNYEITPGQLLNAIQQAQVQPKDIAKFISSYFNNLNISISNKSEIFLKPNLDKLFYHRSRGQLDIAPQPYSLAKSFEDGLSDLTQIAHSSQSRWIEVGEGYWVADPKQSVWYSLGGVAEIRENGIHHDIVPIDITSLGQEQYHVHIHPKEYEYILNNNGFGAAHPLFELLVAKFFAATPSGADYQRIADLLKLSKSVKTTSLIVHSTGITEFRYPNNIAELESMASMSREIRNNILMEIDWEELKRHYKTTDLQKNIQLLFDRLNSTYPPGFSISYHPPKNIKF